jgi:hypothetical protein
MQLLTPEEQWRRVAGYPHYEVSSLGRVKNVTSGRFLRPSVSTRKGKNYSFLRVCLTNGHGAKPYSVHRIAAAAFLGPRPDGTEIDHADGNPLNNAIENLSYVTHAENMRRATRVPKGEGHLRAKITDDVVREIRRREAAGRAKSASLVAEFGIGLKTIYDIRKGRSWKHVTL